MTLPEPLVEVRYGTVETFLLRRVRGGDITPAGFCIANRLGLLRYHVLFGAVVVLVVDGEDRGVPLGKYRGVVEKETYLGKVQGLGHWGGGGGNGVAL